MFGTMGENPASNSWAAQPHVCLSAPLSLRFANTSLAALRSRLRASAGTAVGALDRLSETQISSIAAVLPEVTRPSSDKSAFGAFDLHPSAAISKGERREPFAISWHSQKEVVGKLAWKSALCIWGGPLLALVCLYFLANYLQWIS